MTWKIQGGVWKNYSRYSGIHITPAKSSSSYPYTHASSGMKHYNNFMGGDTSLKNAYNNFMSNHQDLYASNKANYNRPAQQRQSWANFQKTHKTLGSRKKGGLIPKTGIYKLHKHEVVIPTSRVNTITKLLKKNKLKPLF